MIITFTQINIKLMPGFNSLILVIVNIVVTGLL